MTAKTTVAILGGTGYVGRLLCRRLVDHPDFCVGAVVGSSRSVGRAFKEVWETKEAALAANYGTLWEPLPFPPELNGTVIVSLDAVTPGRCTYVVSCLSPDAADVEDDVRRRGLPLFSMSPLNRAGNAFVLEADPTRFLREVRAGRDVFKSPNCVVCGTVLVVQALKERFGLRGLCVTTMQSISGRGDAMYTGERITHNVMPLANSGEGTERCICDELKELLVCEDVSVRAYRLGVHVGHTVDVRIRLGGASPLPTLQEVLGALSAFSPMAHHEDALLLHSTPKHPLVLQTGSGTPQPRQRTSIRTACSLQEGMQVLVGNVEVQRDGWDVVLTLVVHNLIRGAYGAMLQMMEIHLRETRSAS